MVGHHLDRVAGFDAAIDDSDVDDDAAIGIEGGVEDEGAELVRGMTVRRRNAGDDGLENFLDADAGLGAGEEGFVGGNGENLLELAFDGGEIGIREVDLVDDRG